MLACGRRFPRISRRSPHRSHAKAFAPSNHTADGLGIDTKLEDVGNQTAGRSLPIHLCNLDHNSPSVPRITWKLACHWLRCDAVIAPLCQLREAREAIAKVGLAEGTSKSCSRGMQARWLQMPCSGVKRWKRAGVRRHCSSKARKTDWRTVEIGIAACSRAFCHFPIASCCCSSTPQLRPERHVRSTFDSCHFGIPNNFFSVRKKSKKQGQQDGTILVRHRFWLLLVCAIKTWTW